MLKNYIKIAFRNLKNKKAFSFINITGLAVGMAGAILILLWIQNEYSYDSFHANKETLYKVWNRYQGKDNVSTSEVTPSPVGRALKDGFPEVKALPGFIGLQTAYLIIKIYPSKPKGMTWIRRF